MLLISSIGVFMVMTMGGLIGLLNGYFNVKRKITSFIVTICSMYLFRGVCAYATIN